MKFLLHFYFIFAVQTINPRTLQLALETAILSNNDGENLDKGNNDNRSTGRRHNEVSYSKIVYNWLDKSYTCGSDQAKEVATDLLSTVELISQFPLLEYFIMETTKINAINAIKKCANVSINNNTMRKGKPEMEARAKKVQTYFTGAIENGIASEEADERRSIIETEKAKDAKLDKKMNNKFRPLIEEVNEGEYRATNDRGNQKLVKVILDIGDNLKSELNKNRDLREAILGNAGDGVLSVNNVAFRTDTDPNTPGEDDADAGRSHNEETEAGRRDIGDDIVLNNNMEIFVRMNKADGS